MAYPIYYPSGCEQAIPPHYCNPCPVPEHGRIRSIAFIDKGFSFIDPSDPTEWQQGIADKKIIIIPQVNGTYDGGSEVEVAGYGDQQTKLTGYNHQLTYNDPDYKHNCDFYNAIKWTRNYKLAYRTETQVHMVDDIVQVIPKNPVTEETTSEVVWNVLVKWSGEDTPCPYDAPIGIFENCYAYEGDTPEGRPY